MDSTLSNTDCRKDDFMKNRKPAIALILLIDVLVIIGLMALGLIIGFKWIDKKLEEEIRNEVVSYKFEAESETATDEVIEEEKEPEIKINEVWVVNDTGFEPVDKPMEVEYQGFLYLMAKKYDLDFYLLVALIETESDFQADLISETNDYGLMQINKMNHEWLSKELDITDFLDPYQNMKAGCYVLSKLMDSCDGNVTKALMSYNMGYEEADTLWKNGIYSTKYSDKVENRWIVLKGE